MAISGPQSVIAAIRNRLRLFRHAEAQQAAGSQPVEGSLNSKPLSEIPGTKANFEAERGTAVQTGQGEKKG